MLPSSLLRGFQKPYLSATLILYSGYPDLSSTFLIFFELFYSPVFPSEKSVAIQEFFQFPETGLPPLSGGNPAKEFKQ
jgi:hypothetical protein